MTAAIDMRDGLDDYVAVEKVANGERGVTLHTRGDRVAVVRLMHARGRLLKDIAATLGISPDRASKLRFLALDERARVTELTGRCNTCAGHRAAQAEWLITHPGGRQTLHCLGHAYAALLALNASAATNCPTPRKGSR